MYSNLLNEGSIDNLNRKINYDANAMRHLEIERIRVHTYYIISIFFITILH